MPIEHTMQSHLGPQIKNLIEAKEFKPNFNESAMVSIQTLFNNHFAFFFQSTSLAKFIYVSARSESE